MSVKGLFTLSVFPVVLPKDYATILAPAEQFEN